jgi:serine phosphatase RsbU (regulator of sigma subunit)
MEDNIWIGFSGGLQRLTSRKGLRNFYPNTINSFIYSIFEDRTGRIWITSNNGIFYFKDELIEYNPSVGVDNNTFLAALLNNGNILLSNTFGVYEVNVNTLQIIRFSQFPQLSLTPESVFVSSSGEIFLLTGIYGVVYYLENFYSQPRQLKSRNTSNIYQLCEYQGRILGGNNDGIVAFNGDAFVPVMETTCNVWSLHPVDSILWAGTDCGIGRITGNQFESLEMAGYDENVVIKSIVAAKNKNYLWVGTNRGFSYFNTNTREHEFRIDTKDGLSGDEITSGGLYLDQADLLWIGTYHGISNFNIRAKSFRSYAPVCYIESLTLNGEPIDPVSGQTYRHNQNNFVFEISALSFTDEKSVEYEFYLRGTGNNYSSYHRGEEFKAYYNNLPPGQYDFIYKAKGKNNLWGYAESFSFTINKAWYQTWLFRISLGMLILLLAYLFYKGRVRAIELQKNRLEHLVKERTAELEAANTEIEAQRDIATAQRDRIAVQQQEIMDSIQYAQRIQESMLPSPETLSAVLPEHFVLFKPRDIVSGDFYWAAEQNEHVYFTAADCTGHGVPGTFMSMLGMGFLNEIITKHADIEPDQILNELRLYLIAALHQKGASGENKDGMDMVMCKYNRASRMLTYSMANNPLYHVRNGVLNRIKGEPMPVAIHEKMDPFRLGSIELLPGDRIYLFSDGYIDQFGGPTSKKLMSKRFRELILSISDRPMKEQLEILDREFEAWKGDIDQIDDVVVIGIHF